MLSHPPQKLAQPLTPPGLPGPQAWGPGQLRLCRLGGSPPLHIVSWVCDSPFWEGPRGPRWCWLACLGLLHVRASQDIGDSAGSPSSPSGSLPRGFRGTAPHQVLQEAPRGQSLCSSNIQGAGCLLCLGSRLGQSWAGGCPVPTQAWIDASFLRVSLHLYPLTGSGWGARLGKMRPEVIPPP